MADRTVKVTLTAQVAGYISGMEQARQKTSTFSDEAKKKLDAQGKAFSSLGAGALKFGAVAAAGIAIAVAKFAAFDQAMSNVQAALQVSTKSLGQLRAAAIDAGAKTVYSATEAAQAIEELGKNGLTTAQILSGGLSGALSLATAGQLEVGRAAEVAAVSMKQFGLDGSAIPHIADLLAAGAGKAAGDVEDLAQALAQGGLVAHQSGLSIEETTGVLSAFADQGLKGSDAGTSLKSMLQALTPTSQKAQQEMSKLGISAYDQQGQFIGAAKFAGNLQDKLKDLTPEARNNAEAIIFGSDAVRSASVLYTLGAQGIQKYIDQTNDSGYAAKVAADRMNNLSGDLEQLKGSLDTALIQTGSGANDTLRKLTQSVTFLINGFGNLPAPVTSAGLAIGVAGTAVLLLGGGALVAVPKIAAFKTTLQAAGISGKTAAVGIGIATGAITLVTVALGAFISEQASAQARTDSYGESLDAVTHKATAYTRELAAAELAKPANLVEKVFGGQTGSAYDAATAIGVSLKTVTDAATGSKSALEELQPVLSKNQLNSDGVAEAAKKAGLSTAEYVNDVQYLNRAVVGNNDSIKDAIRVAGQKEDADASAKGSNDGLTGSYDGVTEAVDGTVTSLSDLAKELSAQNQPSLDARAAARNLEAAYDDFDAGLKKNGKTLDIHTEKGRANQANLDAIAAAALKSGDAIAANGGSYEDYTKSLEGSRHSLLARIHDLGVTGQAAKDLANDILDIPTKREFQAIADTSNADLAIQNLIAKIRSLPTHIGLTVTSSGSVSFSDSRNSAGDGKKKGKALGGAVAGPGSGTSDDIPAMLSNGEHVLTAAEVSKAGGQGAVYAARARLMTSGRLVFAKGGAVTTDALVDDVKDARADEKAAQVAYDKIKSSQKVAKAKAKAELDRAKKAVTAAEKELSDRREADKALTDYNKLTSKKGEQARDQKFLTAQANNQDSSASGVALAKKYRDEAADALLTNAQNNVQSLRDIIADPNASKKAKAEAEKKLPAQIKALNDLQLKQIGDAAAADADEAAAEAAKKVADDAAQAIQDAADKLAEDIKNIADQFDTIDLTGLEKDVQTFQRVTNADGSVSIFGSTAAGKPTAEGIDAFFADQSTGNQRFAGKLSQLAGKIPVGLLAYLTSLGVEKGEPYADALLAASDTTLASINANYNSSQASATAIGGIVAPLVGQAAGGAVYGPGSGTSDSVIRRLSNGEHVLTAAEVTALGGQSAVYAMRDSWKNGYASQAGRQGQYAPSVTNTTHVSFSTTQYYPQQMTTDQMTNSILAVAGGPSL